MMEKTPNYYLISVSNRTNLDLCIKYAMAGFTNSINGLWTFLDINEGDYISFLYGARVKNLYKVAKKVAYKNAETLPPWPPITFRMSGKTYYFPFRLYLEQERILDEPMIRPEFAYVAENLLLRGGYRKTHFQADTITFYNASNMGEPFNGTKETLNLEAESFDPKIVFRRNKQKIPEKFYFHELILQALIRRNLQKMSVFTKILNHFSIPYEPSEFEILGEKALPEGFVDIFIKLKHPQASNIYLLTEIKTGKAQTKDILQLLSYIQELGGEGKGGILIAKKFSRKILKSAPDNIICVEYLFEDIDLDEEYSYNDLSDMLKLEVAKNGRN